MSEATPTPAEAAPAPAPTENEGENKRVGVIEGLKSLGRGLIAIVKFFGAILVGLPLIWNSIWAAGMITLAVIIIIIVLILIARMNPRIPQMFHSTDVEGELLGLAKDMELSFALLIGSDKTVADGDWMRDHPQLAAHYAALRGALGFVRATGEDSAMVAYYDNDPYQGDLGKSIRSYYIFYDSITKFNCMTKSDLRNNMSEINDGEGSPDRAPFMTSFLRPMDNVREVVTSFSQRLYEIGDFENLSPRPPKLTPAMVKYATLVHELRMMLDQRPDITRMYSTRRGNLPMAIWTAYYAPLVVNMITVRIPAYWMKFPRRYVAALEGALRLWLKIGAMIVAMPCNLAFPDPAERQKKCRSPEAFEAFQPTSDFYSAFLGFGSPVS